MVRIIISGIAGRMGRRIGVLASQDKDIEIAGALEFSGSPAVGKDAGEILGVGAINKKVQSDLAALGKAGDVLIEFTTPESTMEHLEGAAKKKIGMVIGTTALTPQQVENIHRVSKDIPVVLSPNMSVGANLLFKIAEQVARLLGKDYEVEIVEVHHDQKKDAPSGTAKRLGEAVSNAKGKVPPIHSIRLGDIVGDHTVIFAGNGERIELTHRAHSRDAFAKGALDAAKFLAAKKSGLYRMQDVIQSKK
ncbi:MAG: 4-hydroxy-tetrahydrodipicolinate reductase [Candidatus Omnitrophica bacterium]|nr:4-hydroxy-tetrahydrodipicolinate reductase [Candidatus Omnitrophota bacterium]MBU1932669.1 4-hydroxy-tetrahydrodipicolinate reductase [Candidatus Omnitrophota bacterium]